MAETSAAEGRHRNAALVSRYRRERVPVRAPDKVVVGSQGGGPRTTGAAGRRLFGRLRRPAPRHSPPETSTTTLAGAALVPRPSSGRGRHYRRLEPGRSQERTRARCAPAPGHALCGRRTMTTDSELRCRFVMAIDEVLPPAPWLAGQVGDAVQRGGNPHHRRRRDHTALHRRPAQPDGAEPIPDPDSVAFADVHVHALAGCAVGELASRWN